MTRAETLFQFFSGFGLAAYEANTVPTDAVLPYITFTDITGAFNEGELSMTVKIWMKTSSNAPLLSVDDEIFNAIGRSGIVLPYDDGAVWLKRGSPWSQSLKDPDVENLIQRVINISVEYL